MRSQLGGGTAAEWTWTIEPAETPKRMKWVQKADPNISWECVYELAGDSFTIGFVAEGQEIPKTIEASGQLTVYHMTRVAVSK